MNIKSTLAALTVCALVLSNANAQTSRDKAKQIAQANQKSIVMVSATVKMEISGGGKVLASPQQPMQSLGTVIDPSGLVVISASTMDPSGSLKGRTISTPEGPVEVTGKVTQSDVKIVLQDGSSVPARIIYTDSQADLMFILSEKTAAEMNVSPVNLADAAKPALLDELICLWRLPDKFGDVPAATLSEVSAVITKPRTLYLGGKSIGCPTFTLDGKLVGITVSLKIDPESGGTGIFILPAADLAAAAKTALAEKDKPATAPATAPATDPATAPATGPAAPAASPAK